MTRSRGFSIIELLVVIGIISVLTAILVPVLSITRESARQTRCASNLKSIATALGVYAATWNGVLPRSGGYHPASGPLWMVAALPGLNRGPLSSYDELATFDVLHCPSHPTPKTPASFVMNAMAFDVRPQWSRAAPACKWSRIRRQSTVPLLLETPDLFKGQGAWEFNAIFFEPALIVSNPDEFPGGARESVSFTRHRNRQSNVLFADGHVAVVRPGELQLNDFDDGIVGR